ncbi:MAG TPA: hypothetical protein DCZ73_05695 [Bacteroides sp.]|nr:hypothetical protein [Bacteroides sp.]
MSARPFHAAPGRYRGRPGTERRVAGSGKEAVVGRKGRLARAVWRHGREGTEGGCKKHGGSGD